MTLSQDVVEVQRELAQRVGEWDYCGDVADCVASSLRRRGWTVHRIGDGHQAVLVDDVVVDLWNDSQGLVIHYVPPSRWKEWCESP